MTATNPRFPYTYADYLALPEDLSPRYELLHGDFYRVPAPTTRHQQILNNLNAIVRQQVKAFQLGTVLFSPVDVILGEGDSREVAQPDLIFVAASRREIVKLHGIEGPPDLVVEILSPSTEERDRGYKLKMYVRYGIPEYWIVDPQATAIEVYTAGRTEYVSPVVYTCDQVMTCAMLRQIEIDVREVFSDA